MRDFIPHPTCPVKEEWERLALAQIHSEVGISAQQAMQGEKIPPHYRFDPDTGFYVPPNLLDGNRWRH